MLDAVREGHLSPYGYDHPTTPELDVLAESGMKYEQAIAADPWTPPSHAAMFTGKYSTHCHVFGCEPRLSSDQSTLAEELAHKGYRHLGSVIAITRARNAVSTEDSSSITISMI